MDRSENLPADRAAGAPAPIRLPRTGFTGQLDWRQMLIVIRAHLPAALAIALVACTLLGWQQMRRPRLYASTATMALERRDRVLELGRDDSSRFGEAPLLTRLGELQSAEVAEYVAKSLTPEERRLVLGPAVSTRQRANEDAAVLGVVRSSVSINRRPDALLLVVRAVHRDPEAAALIANRYADQFIRYLFDKSSATNNAALVFLRDQAEDLRKKLETSERSLQEYRARYNLVSLDDSQNIVVDRLKALNTSATAARVRRSEIEVRLRQADIALEQHHNPSELAGLAGSDALTEVQQKIDDLEAKRAVLSERYGRRHPAMQEIDRTLSALGKLRDDQVKAALVNLRSQRDKAVAEEKELAAQLATAESDALKLDQLGVEYGVLKRALETQKTIYSQILSRLNEASISSQLESVNVRVADRAMPSAVPFAPDVRKTAMLLACLSLAILLGYPLCVELLFARVRTSSDVEYHIGAPLLGEIGSVRRVAEASRPHLVARDPENPAAEQFRALFSQLQLASKIDPPKSILVTSTVPGEGKSFIASNLAAAFVAHGRKVLLIDADLRRPAQQRNFQQDNKAGLLRWVEGGQPVPADPLTDASLGIREVSPGLFLLRTGGTSRRASEIIAGARVAPLITDLQRRFDILIFDTPPAGVFSDAVSFATFCHELVFVCRFGVASRHQVHSVLAHLRQTGLEFPGVVLNALPSGRGSGYYYQQGYNAAGHYANYYASKPQD